MKKRKKVRRMIQILIAGISLYLFLTTASIYLYSTKDETRHADAAIILGAGASDKGVSPVYRERIHHGVWLYKHGYVNAIIMTGGIGDGNTRSDAYIAKEYAITQGIPEEDIYLEEHSKITQENIKYAKVVMEDYNLKTALVVSDPYHMKRAMLMAKDYKIEAYSSPTKTSMYRSRKTKIPFLLREEFFYVGYRLYRVIDRF